MKKSLLALTSESPGQASTRQSLSLIRSHVCCHPAKHLVVKLGSLIKSIHHLTSSGIIVTTIKGGSTTALAFVDGTSLEQVQG